MSKSARHTAAGLETFESGFHPLPDRWSDKQPTYLYTGRCPISEAELSLPRTGQAEDVARGLTQHLAALELSEGKMFGVLLVRGKDGRLGYGKAFSGLLNGQTLRDGWAPPLHLPRPTPLEADTLERLSQWKVELERLGQQLACHHFPALASDWQLQEDSLRERHRLARDQRARARLTNAVPVPRLEEQSRADSLERRDFNRAKTAALALPQTQYEALRAALLAGKSERRALSRALQAEMHEAFRQSLAADLSCRIDLLFPDGIPTGTGECCAPKLLAWAARLELKPVAMAEFWWGPTAVGDKVSGEFYPACLERCQPLMGPLLSIALRDPVKILFEDSAIVVVDKPSGLLTVPGRYHWNQDCLLHRVEKTHPGALPVHRLDMETSGLVVLARSPEAQSELRRQFENRSTSKVYQALLSRDPEIQRGRLEQPLAPDPHEARCYRLDSAGKEAITEFEVVDRAQRRVHLRPLTGRSHQLRVHMASALKAPIRGDGLYGVGGERLKLHAWRLELDHPVSGERLSFEAPSPF